MKALRDIVLTTEEGDFAEKLDKFLNASHGTSVSSTCHNLPELRSYLDNARVPVAIVDIDNDPHKMLKDLDRLVPLFPKTKFAVACSTSSKDLILEAMQTGVRHFLHKKFIEAELDRVLERLLVDTEKAASDLGLIVTVFSASGGCGATTIALNLANELRLKSSEEVLAIDLDSCYGAISTYLGIQGSYGITDVLGQKERIDSQLIKSSATSYKDGFDVLVGSAGFCDTRNGSGQYPNLAEALEACRAAYKYTIVDSPRVPRQTMRLLANVSKSILVVFQSNVKDIKVAKSMISMLREFNVPSDKIFPLVNRFRRRGPMVPLEEAKKALGLNRMYKVRNDFKKIVNCINRGEPLSELAPHSAVRRDLRSLAESIYAYTENGKGKA